MGYATGYKTPTTDAVRVEVAGTYAHSDKELDWREKRFKQMGFFEYIAEFLATTRIDLHQMEDLLNAGCPHNLAAEILLGTCWAGEDDHWMLSGESEYFAREEDAA